MKKTSKIILFVLVVVALLCGVYRLANKAPSASLESNAQMAEIIESSGCMACQLIPNCLFMPDFRLRASW